MKKNDFVLPILIILLIFFVPATIYGIHRHNSTILDRDNPKHLPKKDGKLYFYDSSDKLLGVYKCQDDKNCDVATTNIDDDINIHYEGEAEPLPVYNGSFVFVKDGNQIYYYWLKNDMVLLTLNSVKNYTIGINGDLLILQDEYLKYGLFDPASGTFLIEPVYDYMALTDTYFSEDGKLSTAKIIVKRDDFYYLIDETENELSAKIADPIYAYDDEAVYTRTDLGNYSVLDYQGIKRINEDFRTIKFLETSNALITTDYMVRIYSKDYINLYYDKRYDSADLTFSEKDQVVTITNSENAIVDAVELKEEVEPEEENPDEEFSDEEDTENEDN